MIEVRLVILMLRNAWVSPDKAQADLQNCFEEGFLLLRADTTNESIVYVLTRQLNAPK